VYLCDFMSVCFHPCSQLTNQHFEFYNRSNKKERRTPAKRDSSGGSGSRSGKGLRLFSMKVCEQVRSKRTTTYNEVANELVKQFMEQESPSSKGHDEKNIRRRVYDALNVLMAVGIITKDKKDIKWQGLPIDYQQEMTNLMDIKKQRLESLQLKGVQLTELIRQQRSLAQLYARNTSPEILNDTSPRINLPFIIVHTDNETSIECEMDTPMTEVFFNFSAPFEIHDDNEILSRLGFDESDQQLLRPQSPQNVSLDQQSVQQQFVDHQNEDNQPSDKVNLVEQAAAAAAVSDSAAVSDNNPQRTQH
jgi:transcription factor Dp-1